MDDILLNLVNNLEDEITEQQYVFFNTDTEYLETDEDGDPCQVDYDLIYHEGIEAIKERIKLKRGNNTSKLLKILSDIRLGLDELEDLVEDDVVSVIFAFNATWRKLFGYKVITARNIEDHAELIYEALAINGDYNLSFSETDVPGILKVKRYSHDEPTGCSLIVIADI
jgi:hypothetical protein